MLLHNIANIIWILGLFGLLATFVYMNFHRLHYGWSIAHTWDIPRSQLPLCISASAICLGFALSDFNLQLPAFGWEIIMWFLLASLFLLQSAICIWFGLNNWDRPFHVSLVQRKKATSNQNLRGLIVFCTVSGIFMLLSWQGITDLFGTLDHNPGIALASANESVYRELHTENQAMSAVGIDRHHHPVPVENEGSQVSTLAIVEDPTPTPTATAVASVEKISLPTSTPISATIQRSIVATDSSTIDSSTINSNTVEAVTETPTTQPSPTATNSPTSEPIAVEPTYTLTAIPVATETATAIATATAMPVATATNHIPATEVMALQITAATPTSIPTATPVSTATAVVAKTYAEIPSWQIWPPDYFSGHDRVDFKWQAAFDLEESQAFEVVFWRPGQTPIEDGFGIALPTKETELHVYMIEMDEYLGQLLVPGQYQWGILLVETEPTYKRIAYLGIGNNIMYHPEERLY